MPPNPVHRRVGPGWNDSPRRRHPVHGAAGRRRRLSHLLRQQGKRRRSAAVQRHDGLCRRIPVRHYFPFAGSCPSLSGRSRRRIHRPAGLPRRFFRGPGTVYGQAGPGNRCGRRPQRPAHRPARFRQDHAGQENSYDSAAHEPARIAGGDEDIQRSRPVSAVENAGAAALPQSSPYDFHSGPHRRRHDSQARRGHPEPQRRPISRRAARVSPIRAGSAAPAPGGFCRPHLPSQRLPVLSGPLHPHRRHESLPLRLFRQLRIEFLHLHDRRNPPVCPQNIGPSPGPHRPARRRRPAQIPRTDYDDTSGIVRSDPQPRPGRQREAGTAAPIVRPVLQRPHGPSGNQRNVPSFKGRPGPAADRIRHDEAERPQLRPHCQSGPDDCRPKRGRTHTKRTHCRSGKLPQYIAKGVTP